MNFQTIRGTFDVLPDAQTVEGGTAIPGSAAWRHAEAVVRGVLERFGFEEVRTPILEAVELIARGVGSATDIVQKEMFTVERGDATYVLRPEVTAPVMRAYLEHRLAQRGGTQRLYYLGPCFRAERPQKGRFRQFHQFGIELLGEPGPTADAEAVACLTAVYAAFGITNTRLRLNTLGDRESRPRFRAALRDFLAPHAADLSETSRARLDTNPLRILDTKAPHEIALLDGAPRMLDFLSTESRDHYETVKGLLTDLGIAFEEDPRLVRGLDYYTRTAFELESVALGAQSALGGGGRYDGLAQELGNSAPVPAVGFACGMERLFLVLAAQGYSFPETERPDAFLVALGAPAARWAFFHAQRLRAEGISVVFDLAPDRPFRKQLTALERSGARHAVIVGDAELAAGAAQVKSQATGEQRTVPFGELAAALRAFPVEG